MDSDLRLGRLGETPNEWTALQRAHENSHTVSETLLGSRLVDTEMAIGVRAGSGSNGFEEFDTRFILKESRAKRTGYRLKRSSEPHLLPEII